MGRFRLLVVDDNHALRRSLIDLLTVEEDFDVVGEAADGEEAVELARQLKPDVVLMDVKMPRMDGIAATAQILRERPDVQVLAHTAYSDLSLVSDMVRSGARSYVLKGGPARQLVQCIRGVLAGESYVPAEVARAVLDDVRTLHLERERQADELARVMEQMHTLERTDGLTGLANYYRVREAAAGAAPGTELGLLVADLDGFTALQAVHGRSAGDSLLVAVADKLREATPVASLVARTGPDEFSVVWTSTAEDPAVAETCWKGIDKLARSEGAMGVSAGWWAGAPADIGADRWWLRALEALWQARASGGGVLRRAESNKRVHVVGSLAERERAATVLLRALQAKDLAAYLHAQRVATVAVVLGQALGCSPWELQVFREGALLHDIGMALMPDTLVQAPRPHSPDMARRLGGHVLAGEALVHGVFPADVVAAVRYHHERWDGGGYPDRVAGAGIPFAARVVAVAEAWAGKAVAPGAEQPVPAAAIVDELRAQSGKAYDPRLVATVVGLARAGRMPRFDQSLPND